MRGDIRATTDAPGPARRRATPWGLVGMVALVAAIESLATRHRDEFAAPITDHFEASGRAARTESAGRDLLFFGDSVVKFGVIPRLIEERTGLRGYNLATIANPAPASYVLLRRALGAGARPRAIFVDFKPILLAQHLPDLPSMARIADLRDGLELAWTARDPDFFGSFAMSRALPTFRDRLAIRSWLVRSLRAEADPERPGLEARRANREINQGAQVIPPNPLAATTPEFPNEGLNLRPDWSCDPINAAYVARFFRLAAGHGIPAFWLITPVHPRLQAGRDRIGVDAALTRFIRDRAEAAGVTVVDARRLGLDPDLFVDATHLDRRGAVALSAALADFLGRPDALDRGGRWVVLPPRARPADDRRLQDTDQTGLALRRESDARRR